MSAGAGTGQAVALALEAQDDDAQADETQQLDLLGVEPTEQVLEKREKRNAKGRPPGARNKRTVEMANYLLSRYTSPLEVLAQIATARIDELSMLIGCTKLEALQEKRLAALGLLPYLHQKQPVAVDVTNRKVVHLTIVEDGNAGSLPAEDGAEITLTATLIDKQNALDAAEEDGDRDGR